MPRPNFSFDPTARGTPAQAWHAAGVGDGRCMASGPVTPRQEREAIALQGRAGRVWAPRDVPEFPPKPRA